MKKITLNFSPNWHIATNCLRKAKLINQKDKGKINNLLFKLFLIWVENPEYYLINEKEIGVNMLMMAIYLLVWT